MATIHLHQTTTATPEQFVAGLTDFGPGRSELFGNSADELPQGARPGPRLGRRHRGLGRRLGTPALRLVRPQPRRPDDHRLQRVGRRLGPHLHLHAAARRDDRRGRRRGARGQEPQGAGARGRGRDLRQARPGKGAGQHRQGDRSADEGRQLRLPNTAHTSRPWRIHELTRDFRVEDVWALPTPGGPDDFPRLVAAVGLGRPVAGLLPRRPRAVRDPLEGREAARLGRPGHRPRLQGTDAPRPLAGGSARRPSRPGSTGPFTSLYLTRDEWAGEIANRTDARGHAPRLGPGRDGRLPRADGRPGEAETDCSGPPTWPRSGRSGT